MSLFAKTVVTPWNWFRLLHVQFKLVTLFSSAIQRFAVAFADVALTYLYARKEISHFSFQRRHSITCASDRKFVISPWGRHIAKYACVSDSKTFIHKQDWFEDGSMPCLWSYISKQRLNPKTYQKAVNVWSMFSAFLSCIAVWEENDFVLWTKLFQYLPVTKAGATLRSVWTSFHKSQWFGHPVLQACCAKLEIPVHRFCQTGTSVVESRSRA